MDCEWADDFDESGFALKQLRAASASCITGRGAAPTTPPNAANASNDIDVHAPDNVVAKHSTKPASAGASKNSNSITPYWQGRNACGGGDAVARLAAHGYNPSRMHEHTKETVRQLVVTTPAASSCTTETITSASSWEDDERPRF
mmetsp:Transcript_1976/g.4577  ORF Transcript_1976/g.4577 Transcript_1976/m.4577 type:complete len:145 (-) Transcript_1976:475-909(-)|eukprot:CAMPEP_0178999456 /NCGR_PEP_ID=MMETSP0795-20121207/10077_1 /TAXON_ID=88552 /ORGANISM="Amoebophrya sp., Strain Ameob2" /LENGTH=144 /DNA_ID=CAMNT_0020692245 /DNA_START=73 /DNA_END=507 /DNA_ORIENTATION=+